MIVTKSRLYKISGFLLIYFALVFLASLYNDAPYRHWQSEIHNDKAGYYIYLPSTFIHGYYFTEEMGAIREELHGFKYENGKMFTKYPMGVAILVLPFFLIAHIVALAGAGPANGFSAPYYEMTYFASVFYFLLGAIILYKFLRKRFSLPVTLVTLATLMLATNAFYYALREPLFSHIYSFFLFSLLLNLTERHWESPNIRNFSLLAVVSALIFLVRPTNLIILPVILFLGITSADHIRQRVKFIFNPRSLLTFIALFLLFILPQLIYWKFLSGSFLFYSYEEEGFKYWNNPQIAKVLFSPNNGLLVYSPAYLLALAGMILMIVKKEADRWLVPAITLVLLYMVSSWHSFHFGCSFGQRSFVEFLALFSLPMAFLFKWLLKLAYPVVASAAGLIIAYLVYVSISLSSVYPKCFEGGYWEWQPYGYYYYQAKIFPVYQQRVVNKWTDDFEKKEGAFSRKKTVENPLAFSGRHVSRIDSTTAYSDNFVLDLSTLAKGHLVTVDVKMECFFDDPPEEALVVCSIENEKGIFFYKTFPIHEESRIKPGVWKKIRTTFAMQSNPSEGMLKVYVWRKKGGNIYLDDVRVEISVQKSSL